MEDRPEINEAGPSSLSSRTERGIAKVIGGVVIFFSGYFEIVPDGTPHKIIDNAVLVAGAGVAIWGGLELLKPADNEPHEDGSAPSNSSHSQTEE